jgi:hypothetical protein
MTLYYWSIPVILLLHELEEWDILKWYQRCYLNPPPSDNLAVRTWILFCSMVGFVWTFISVMIPNNHITALLMAILIFITIQNAIQHFCWQILFRAYSPGIIFSTVGLVMGVYVCIQATNQGLLPLWVNFILLIGLIPVTIETIKARNTMTKAVLAVHLFGIKLANSIWIK